MNEQITIMGSDANLGELIRVFKTRAFVGKQNMRGVYHTRYEAGFYNPDSKVIAWYASDEPITTIVRSKTVSQIKQFLLEHGYSAFSIS